MAGVILAFFLGRLARCPADKRCRRMQEAETLMPTCSIVICKSLLVDRRFILLSFVRWRTDLESIFLFPPHFPTREDESTEFTSRDFFTLLTDEAEIAIFWLYRVVYNDFPPPNTSLEPIFSG